MNSARMRFGSLKTWMGQKWRLADSTVSPLVGPRGRFLQLSMDQGRLCILPIPLKHSLV